MKRFLRVHLVLGVLAVLASCAYFQPKAPDSPLLRGAYVDGGSNPNDDLLTPGNRGDVMVLSGNADFRGIGDRFQNIETLSMRNSDRARGNSTITLDIIHVLRMADTGFADPTDADYGRHPALRVDGDVGDTLVLANGDGGWAQAVSGGSGRWVRGAGNGSNGVPAGYDLYVHVRKGANPTAGADAYLVVQQGITVDAR
jgi:hypothetical protein